jgi:hypothetical protein
LFTFGLSIGKNNRVVFPIKVFNYAAKIDRVSGSIEMGGIHGIHGMWRDPLN